MISILLQHKSVYFSYLLTY